VPRAATRADGPLTEGAALKRCSCVAGRRTCPASDNLAIVGRARALGTLWSAGTGGCHDLLEVLRRRSHCLTDH
jgi:hypothetical protein